MYRVNEDSECFCPAGYVFTEKDKAKVCPEKATALGDPKLVGMLQAGETLTLEVLD